MSRHLQQRQPSGLNSTTAHRLRRDATVLEGIEQMRIHSLATSLADMSLHSIPPSSGTSVDPMSSSRDAEVIATSMPTLDGHILNIDSAGRSRSVASEAHDLQFLCRAFQGARVSFQPQMEKLGFARDPVFSGPASTRDDAAMVRPNDGMLKLDELYMDNKEFLRYEGYCYQLALDLEDIPVPSVATLATIHTHLLDCVYDEIHRLESMKAHEWNARRHGTQSRATYLRHATSFQEDLFVPTPGSLLLQSCTMTAVILHLLFHVPQRPVRLLLGGMRSVVRRTIAYAEDKLGAQIPTVDAAQQPIPPIWQEIPRRIDTIVSAYDLDPKLDAYVVCSECFALYDTASAPDVCRYKDTPSSGACDQPLWRTRQIRAKLYRKPKLQYYHQPFGSWLSRLFSRPDIEDVIDSAAPVSTPPEYMTDFWDAEIARTFTGPAEYLSPYMDKTAAPPGTARLIFALAADGFNPFQTKPGKGTVTSTGIYLVCMNLPPHLRYLPENIYLAGIIPGKPEKEQMNHYLKLIVDDLLPFWNTGVFLSATAKYTLGRWVNAALIPLVADLVAARQLMAIGSHSMTFFCSCCYITLDDMENFDPATWPPRDLAAHRQAAAAWRDAPSTAAREALFNETGIRWTELLRLPYWDPLRYTVIDSMHNHYLGILKTHLREIWGMSMAVDGDGLAHPTRKEPARPSLQLMAMGRFYLLHGTENQLKTGCLKAVLWHMCLDRGVRRAGTINQLVKNLMKWRTREGFPVPPPQRMPGQDQQSVMLGSTNTANAPAHSQPMSSISASVSVGVPSIFGVSISSRAPTEGSVASTSSSATVTASPSANLVIPANLPPEVEPYRNILRLAELSLRNGVNVQALARRRRVVLEYMCSTRGLSTNGNCLEMASLLIAQNATNSQAVSVVPSSSSTYASSSTSAVADDPPVVQMSSRGVTQDNRDNQDSATGALSLTAPQPDDEPLSQGHQDMPLPQLPLPPPPQSRPAPQPLSPPSPQPPQAQPQRPRRRGPVLGRETLTEVYADVSRTELPSWVSAAPSNFGTAKRGKLSADQFRTLATIHLPITLIRLWGNDTGRQKELLNNFMDLVSSVEVGGMLSMSEQHIVLYETLVLRYLRTMVELYPEASVHPNHHLAVHIGGFLRSFGPVHSWRSFAFERFNYMLQQLNVNMRIGEVERTFMFSSCRAANLRPLLRSKLAQEAIQDALEIYNSILLEDGRGTRVVDSLRLAAAVSNVPQPSRGQAMHKDDFVLGDLEYRALIRFLNDEAGQQVYAGMHNLADRNNKMFMHPRAKRLSKIAVGGVTYKPRSKDGNVLLWKDGIHGADSFATLASSTYAARILDIFAHERRSTDNTSVREVFLSVQRLVHLEPQHASYDIYRKYKISGGFLCYDRYHPQLMIVRTASVVCHFARTANISSTSIVDEEGALLPCVHVLPLDRLLRLVDPQVTEAEDNPMDIDQN